MKRWMLAAGTLVAGGLIVTAWLTQTPQVAAQSGYTVTWEAEGASKIEEPFKKRNGRKSDKRPKPQKNSGSGYVEIPDKANGSKKEGDGSDLRGVAEYNVIVAAAGSYTVWARVLWPNGCGNSFWVLKQGRPKDILGEDGTYDAWHWVAAKTKVTLAKGVNVIELRNREDGVLVDELQVTTTGRVPTGEVARPRARSLTSLATLEQHTTARSVLPGRLRFGWRRPGLRERFPLLSKEGIRGWFACANFRSGRERSGTRLPQRLAGSDPPTNHPCIPNGDSTRTVTGRPKPPTAQS